MSPLNIPVVHFSGSILSVLLFVLDLIAAVQVIQSNRPMSSKILWCLLIFLFPVGGVIIYYLLEHKERRRLRYISIP